MHSSKRGILLRDPSHQDLCRDDPPCRPWSQARAPSHAVSPL